MLFFIVEHFSTLNCVNTGDAPNLFTFLSYWHV